MRPREDELIDPEVAEQLDAIDATLAGDPVAPRFAELAELALLVSAARAEGMRPEFAAELDRRVEARFGRAPAESSRRGREASPGGRSRRWSWSWAPVWGSGGAAAVAAVLVAVVLVSGGGGSPGPSTGTVAGVTDAKSSAGVTQNAAGGPKATRGTTPAAKTAAPALPHRTARTAPTLTSASSLAAPNAPTATGGGGTAAAGAVNGPAMIIATPAPVPNGRKIVQSSILQLGAPGNRIDAVAQGVFNVVGAVNGIVDRS
ncbi:MAG TPA: hypothetical protein VG295_03180, partial [Solirubrobacteraceae bacterium]|nr:hypothetical protein [Solirubrobacteraceae bacterium]